QFHGAGMRQQAGDDPAVFFDGAHRAILPRRRPGPRAGFATRKYCLAMSVPQPDGPGAVGPLDEHTLRPARALIAAKAGCLALLFALVVAVGVILAPNV